MLVLHYAPRTRAHRIRWLLEELGLDYELRRGTYRPPADTTFVQATPTGKFPVLEDGDVVVGESGAILLYVLERYGAGRLAPPVGSPLRAAFLQWVFFAEATAFPPIVTLVWHGRHTKGGGEPIPALRDDASRRAQAGLDVVEAALAGSDYLVGDAFTGADVMMGFTLVAAKSLGLIGDRPRLASYLSRLEARPAFQKAFAD